MPQIYANNASSTLSAGLAAVDTTIFIQPGQGVRFPTVTAPDFCAATLEDASGNIEIVRVTAHAVSATALTVVRAQQGTAARAYGIGDLFELRLTALETTAWEADIDALQASRSLKAGDTYTGTHDFSAASVVSLPANTLIGPVSAAEIVALDGITGNVQGQIDSLSVSTQTRLDAKAAKAGDVYTGNHDFTATTALRAPTRPTGTNDTTVATTAFVVATALGTVLPGQTGNAGKFISTDGINAGWVSLPPLSGSDLFLFQNFKGL